jgi:hypothetical protein
MSSPSSGAIIIVDIGLAGGFVDDAGAGIDMPGMSFMSMPPMSSAFMFGIERERNVWSYITLAVWRAWSS